MTYDKIAMDLDRLKLDVAAHRCVGVVPQSVAVGKEQGGGQHG